jgi:uncharacterized RDD family membrane protein YckC
VPNESVAAMPASAREAAKPSRPPARKVASAAPPLARPAPPSARPGAAAGPPQREAESHAPQPARPKVTFAGFWMRFFAYLIDASILAVVVGIIDYLIAMAIGKSIVEFVQSLIEIGMTGTGGALLFFGAILTGAVFRVFIMWFLSLVFGWIYFAFFEASASMATPGKTVFGLKVVDADGNRISFWQASLRHAGKFAALAPMIISFVLFIGAVSSEKSVGPALFLLVVSVLLTPILTIIVYGMAGWTLHKQALYDRFANCFVIRAKQLNPGLFMGLVFAAIVVYLIVHTLLKSVSG